MITYLTVLGSGTIIPQKNRSCAGYVLHDSGTPILMDCGPGSLLRLGEAGISVRNINLVLISHFPLDHVSDLAPLLMARWLQDIDLAQKGEITVAGPVGLRKWFTLLAEQTEDWLAELKLNLVEMESSSHRFGSLKVDSRPTLHTENSLCFRLTDERGKVLFYSGDTYYSEALVTLARRADLAVIECSVPESRREEGHLSPRLAGKLASEARVKKLLLTHFYEEVLAVKILKQVSAFFSGKVYLARDLKNYSIS